MINGIPKWRNVALSLLILAFFLGGTVEVSEGSKAIGVIYLLFALIATTRIKIVGLGKIKKVNQSHLFIGLGIIICDILYNIASNMLLGTIDIMTFFFGLSLVTLSVDNEDMRRMGKFTSYLSATFLILYLFFFTLFNILNINFTHIFDHFFILIPVVFILNFIKIPVEVIGIETIHISGAEEMNIVIGGPCSGLYSMFLLIGIIIGYVKMEKIGTLKIVSIFIITIIVGYIANIFRIVVLYLIGYFYGSNLMMFVHTHLGWVIFGIVAGLMIFILNRTV
jgi:archaeosortase C (PEF-CTERM variant)